MVCIPCSSRVGGEGSGGGAGHWEAAATEVVAWPFLLLLCCCCHQAIVCHLVAMLLSATWHLDSLSTRGMGGQGCADSPELAQPQTNVDSDDTVCRHRQLTPHHRHHVAWTSPASFTC